jgi:hypothetical protein
MVTYPEHAKLQSLGVENSRLRASHDRLLAAAKPVCQACLSKDNAIFFTAANLAVALQAAIAAAEER